MKHNNLYFGVSLLAVSSIATVCNGPTDGTISLSDIPIKAGQKQLCFYVGDSLEGNIWIDNITMKLE